MARLALLIVCALSVGGRPASAEKKPELVIVGSGNLARFLEPIGAAFEAQQPGVSVSVASRTSSAGPPALLSGSAQLASMSRPMTDDELHVFQRKYARFPQRFAVGIDALAVYVNSSNPLERITLGEIDDIFSRTHRCGGAGTPEITHWGQLGLEGDWARREIGLYGPVPSSGTHAFFRMRALCGGQFRDDVKLQPGGRSIVLSLSEARHGIGYGPRADRSKGIKALAVAERSEGPFATIEADDVESGAYPLTRDLYLYRLEPPVDAGSQELVDEFLRLVLSPQGQGMVEAAGFLKLPDGRIIQALSQLEATPPPE